MQKRLAPKPSSGTNDQQVARSGGIGGLRWKPTDLVPFPNLIIWTNQSTATEEHAKVTFAIQNDIYNNQLFVWKIFDHKGRYTVSPSCGTLHPHVGQIVIITCTFEMANTMTDCEDALRIMFHPVDDDNINLKTFWKDEVDSPKTNGLSILIKFLTCEEGPNVIEPIVTRGFAVPIASASALNLRDTSSSDNSPNFEQVKYEIENETPDNKHHHTNKHHDHGSSHHKHDDTSSSDYSSNFEQVKYEIETPDNKHHHTNKHHDHGSSHYRHDDKHHEHGSSHHAHDKKHHHSNKKHHHGSSHHRHGSSHHDLGSSHHRHGSSHHDLGSSHHRHGSSHHRHDHASQQNVCETQQQICDDKRTISSLNMHHFSQHHQPNYLNDFEDGDLCWKPHDLVPVEDLVVWRNQPPPTAKRVKVNFIIQNYTYTDQKFVWKIYDNKNIYRIKPSYGILQPDSPQLVTISCPCKLACKLTNDYLEMVFQPTNCNKVNWRSYWRKELNSPDTDGLKIKLKFVSGAQGQTFFETMPTKKCINPPKQSCQHIHQQNKFDTLKQQPIQRQSSKHCKSVDVARKTTRAYTTRKVKATSVVRSSSQCASQTKVRQEPTKRKIKATSVVRSTSECASQTKVRQEPTKRKIKATSVMCSTSEWASQKKVCEEPTKRKIQATSVVRSTSECASQKKVCEEPTKTLIKETSNCSARESSSKQRSLPQRIFHSAKSIPSKIYNAISKDMEAWLIDTPENHNNCNARKARSRRSNDQELLCEAVLSDPSETKSERARRKRRKRKLQERKERKEQCKPPKENKKVEKAPRKINSCSKPRSMMPSGSRERISLESMEINDLPLQINEAETDQPQSSKSSKEKHNNLSWLKTNEEQNSRASKTYNEQQNDELPELSSYKVQNDGLSETHKVQNEHSRSSQTKKESNIRHRSSKTNKENNDYDSSSKTNKEQNSRASKTYNEQNDQLPELSQTKKKKKDKPPKTHKVQNEHNRSSQTKKEPNVRHRSSKTNKKSNGSSSKTNKEQEAVVQSPQISKEQNDDRSLSKLNNSMSPVDKLSYYGTLISVSKEDQPHVCATSINTSQTYSVHRQPWSSKPQELSSKEDSQEAAENDHSASLSQRITHTIFEALKQFTFRDRHRTKEEPPLEEKLSVAELEKRDENQLRNEGKEKYVAGASSPIKDVDIKKEISNPSPSKEKQAASLSSPKDMNVEKTESTRLETLWSKLTWSKKKHDTGPTPSLSEMAMLIQWEPAAQESPNSTLSKEKNLDAGLRHSSTGSLNRYFARLPLESAQQSASIVVDQNTSQNSVHKTTSAHTLN